MRCRSFAFDLLHHARLCVFFLSVASARGVVASNVGTSMPMYCSCRFIYRVVPLSTTPSLLIPLAVLVNPPPYSVNQVELHLSVIPNDPSISQLKVYGDLPDLHIRLSQVLVFVFLCVFVLFLSHSSYVVFHLVHPKRWFVRQRLQ